MSKIDIIGNYFLYCLLKLVELACFGKLNIFYEWKIYEGVSLGSIWFFLLLFCHRYLSQFLIWEWYSEIRNRRKGYLKWMLFGLIRNDSKAYLEKNEYIRYFKNLPFWSWGTRLEGLSWLFPCGEECILMIKKKKKIWMLDTGTGFEYMIWISDYLFWSKDFEGKDQILLWV